MALLGRDLNPLEPAMHEKYSDYLLRMANDERVPAATREQARVLAIEAQRNEEAERARVEACRGH